MSGDATQGVSNRPRLAADLIAQRAFTVVRRGYDQDEVRAYLDQVASEVRGLHRRIDEMPEAAQAAIAPQPVDRLPLDEEGIVALVGEETANVLRAARTAAVDLRRRAETEAERIVDEARQASGAMRQDAESALAGAQREAELAAEEIVRAAGAEAEQLLAKARADVDGLRDQAEQERRLTVDGAQAVREKILGDLSRRRRVATVQIEQLRAGRERLLESYGVVRRTLEEVHDELQRADTEARAAADEAGRKAEAEPDPVSPEISTSSDAGVRAGATPAQTTPGTKVDPATQTDPATQGTPAPPPNPEEAVAPAPGAAADRPAPVPPPGGPEAGVIITDDGIERVRVLRSEPRSGAPGAPVLRSIPGGKMAAGGDPPVELVDPGVADPATVKAENVEGVFDRIRAGLEASVESARQVLDRPASGNQPGDSDIVPPPGDSDIVPPPGDSDIVPPPGDSDIVPPPGDSDIEPPPGEHDMEPPRSDEDEALLQGRDRLVIDIEAGLTKKLKRRLQDEQNELLDRLRGVRGAPKAATLLPDEPDHTARMAGVCRPLLDQAARAGATFAGGEGGDDIGRLAGEVADEMAVNLVAPLRRRLTQAIRDNGSDDQAVLVEAIGAVYRECKTQRVEHAVVDGVAMAFSRGIFSAVPPGAPLRWVVEDTDGPCPDCDDNALAGFLPRGEAFPTGQLHPPAHAGCRCLLASEGRP